MQIFTLVSTVLFVLLWLVWSTKTWTNMLIKITLFGMSAWGAFLSLQAAGYLVKAAGV